MSLVLDSTGHEHYRTGYIAAVDHRRSPRAAVIITITAIPMPVMTTITTKPTSCKPTRVR